MHKNTPPPFSGPRPNIVHFIGIGGIGMSALARWFFTQKWAVSGSDISSNETTQSLQKLGIKVKFGHKKANIPQDCVLVVYTQAIRPENIELKEARQRKIPVLSYPEAIGRLTKSYKTIAITGAHGKSTTTALVGLILIKAGFDPTVIIGTKLKEFGGNFRNGSTLLTTDRKKSYLVLEADEYGGAFLNYSPLVTTITNIDREHLDFYKNLGDIKKSFLTFFKKTERGGTLVLNRNNGILFSLKPAIEKIAEENNLKIVWYSLKDSGVKKIRAILKIPGEHNVSNALAAFTAAKVLGIPEKTVLRAISGYRGSWRRMEYRGKYQVSSIKYQVSGNKNPKRLLPDTVYQIPVYDDYAHHPTEIKATLQAFREKFPNKKIICVFQPHQAERLKLLFKDFQSAFADADIALILPIYQVAGRDKVNPAFTSEKLVRAIQKKYPEKLVFYIANPKNLKNALKTLLPATYHLLPTPLLIMMGAGDIVRYTDLLLKN